MAKFDIVTMRTEGPVEASYAPVASPLGLRTDITRIRSEGVGLGPPHRGFRAPGVCKALGACLGAFVTLSDLEAKADPAAFVPTATATDPPPTNPPVPPLTFRPSWDLDGTYLWLGPSGAAGWIDNTWDSIFGADASIVRVRERETLGAIGGSVGASRWTVRGGGRVWLDAVIGTPIGSHMVGASAGPILELSDVAHPRIGASVGVWGFVGVTPFVRVGAVESTGMFAEIGVHIALPVIRR